jgi:mono/diheme cytochrome c family protein
MVRVLVSRAAIGAIRRWLETRETRVPLPSERLADGDANIRRAHASVAFERRTVSERFFETPTLSTPEACFLLFFLLGNGVPAMSTAMMRRFGGRLMSAMVLGVSFSLAGCERDASGLTEWTPADHDHQTEPKTRGRNNLAAVNQRKVNPRAAPSQRNQVIDVTWAKQCATCHGRRGKGDGPSSTMVKARDLTTPEFQANVSDEQLKKVIREGKDKMPAFNLPDSIIDGLVEHVRGFARKARRGDADENDGENGAGSPEEAAPAPNAPAAATTVEPAPAGAADKAAPSPTGSAASGGTPSADPAPVKAPAPPSHP